VIHHYKMAKHSEVVIDGERLTVVSRQLVGIESRLFLSS